MSLEEEKGKNARATAFESGRSPLGESKFVLEEEEEGEREEKASREK